MDTEVLQNHSRISATAAGFLQYAVAEGNCLSRLQLLDDSLPVLFRNYPYTLHSWPWFIYTATRTMLEECAQNVLGLVTKALQLEFAGDSGRLASFYAVPDIVAEVFLSSGVDLGQLMQRADAVITDRGLKIMELNVGSNIGGWQIQWMDKQYRKNPSLAPFLSAHPCQSRNIPLNYLTHVIQATRRGGYCGRGTDVTVAVVTDMEFFSNGGQDTIEQVFRQALERCRCSGRIFFCSSYDDLGFDAAGVSFAGTKIGAVLSVHLNLQALQPPTQLHRAYLGSKVFWPDNAIAGILGNKQSLALLYKHRQHPRFSAYERKLIERFVPWSAALFEQEVEFEGSRRDLRALLLERQSRFVVKVGSGAQGKGVHVGRHTQPQQWQAIIARAFAEGSWLAQEYCASLPFYGQSTPQGFGLYDVVWGVFTFGHQYGGCWLRMMARDSGDGVINSARGAEETIVYEVED